MHRWHFLIMASFLLNDWMAGSEKSAQSDISTDSHSLATRASDEAGHLPKELVSLPSTSNIHAVCPLGTDYGLCSPQTSPGNHVGEEELPSAETMPRRQLITKQFGGSLVSA